MSRRKTLGRNLIWLIGICLASSAMLRVGAYADVALAAPGTQPSAQTEAASCPAPPAQIARALVQREEDARAREAALGVEMAKLEEAKAQLAAQIARMQTAEAALRKTISLAEGAAEKDVQQLTEIYQAMKPKDAAALFGGMDSDFAAGFLGRMRPAEAAGILAGMDPGAAYAISAVLAGRNTDVPRQ